MILELKLSDICNMPNIINKMSKLGTFCFTGNVTYLDTKYCKDFVLTSLGENVEYLGEVNISNYSDIKSNLVKSWCFEKLVEKEVHEFEQSDECQNRLREISEYLDKVEKQMKEGDNVVGGKGSVKNGKRKRRKRKKKK